MLLPRCRQAAESVTQPAEWECLGTPESPGVSQMPTRASEGKVCMATRSACRGILIYSHLTYGQGYHGVFQLCFFQQF